MALLGRIGNRYDPGPVSSSPGRRAEVIARVANALAALTDLLRELTEEEALAAYREAKARIDKTDELEREL